MKRIFSALVIVYTFTLVAHAQFDYKPGFIVTHNSDTVHGLIDYRGYKSNAVECHFKKDASSIALIYSPLQIHSYKFLENKYYVSKQLDSTRTVFLEYLINGTVDIYYYRDGESIDHYYIDKGNNKLVELISREEIVIINNERFSKRNNNYIGVLKSVFQKSPSIQSRIDNGMSLKHSTLIDIAKDYHHEVCPNEECIVYEMKIPNKVFTYGIAAGVNAFSIPNTKNSFSEKFTYFKNVNFEYSFGPSFGLFFRRNIPSLNEKVFMLYEIGIHQKNAKSSHENIVHTYQTIDVSFTSLNNTVSLRYEFPNNKIRPLIQGGFFHDIFLITRYSRNEITRSRDGVLLSSTHHDTSPFARSDMGFVVGSGLIFKLTEKRELYVDLRYYKGIGLVGSNLPTQNFSLNFKYSFKSKT